MLCAEVGLCVMLDLKGERTRGVVYGQNFSSGFSDPFWIACVFVAVLSEFCWQKNCTLSTSNILFVQKNPPNCFYFLFYGVCL